MGVRWVWSGCEGGVRWVCEGGVRWVCEGGV